MIIEVRNPIPRLTVRRTVAILFVLLAVAAVAVPATLYWSLQRNDMHAQWAQQERSAFEVWRHTDNAAGLLGGYYPPNTPWNNESEVLTISELGGAEYGLNGVSLLDVAHADQLGRIFYALTTLETQNYIHNMTSTQRIQLSNQLELLGHDVLNAYSNYYNYTSSGTVSGPPFWYNGPAPPEEQLLQNAVNIACTFQRGGCL